MLYLTAGGRNPTRHQLLVRGFSWPQHFDEVRAALAARPALVVVLTAFVRPDDAFVASLAPQYEVVERGEGWAIYGPRNAGPAGN